MEDLFSFTSRLFSINIRANDFATATLRRFNFAMSSFRILYRFSQHESEVSDKSAVAIFVLVKSQNYDHIAIL